MKNDEFNNSYSLYEVILAASSASIGACVLIFLFFHFLLVSYSGHPWQSSPTSIDFLIASSLCFSSYFLAALIAFSLKNWLQRFMSSWLIVSFFGSLIFTLTFSTIAFINSIKSFQPDSHFSPPPPEFSEMIWSALLLFFAFFTFACLFSFAAFYVFPKREKEMNLHLR